MIFSVSLKLVGGWTLAFSSMANAIPTSSHTYAPEYFATQSVSSAAPSFSVQTRRRINNCHEQWMKDTEAQAWADAGEIANIAQQWVPDRDETLQVNPDSQNNSTSQTAGPRKWQPAMDYFMGTDSTTSGAKDKIAYALENEKKAHSGNWIFPEAVIDIYCGSHPDRDACPLQTNPRDPTGPKVTAYARSWVSRGWFWNSYNVVLCPRFFYEKDSLWGILKLMDLGHIDKSNASAYKDAWGHTIYHELMHLDPVVAKNEVFDVKYGACNVAKLAKKNGCTGENPVDGWNPANGKPNSLNNADSFALYASAAYFQNILKLDSPGTAPDCDVNGPFVASEDDFVEGILDVPDDLPPELMTASVPPDAQPSQIPGPDGPVPTMPFNGDATPSGLATPYAGASAYFASLASASVNTSTSAPSTATQTATCMDNQIEGSCTEASYPSMTPNSGIQAPICNKVDDTQNNLVRINADKAKQAAADYCASLASQKVILSSGSGGPQPAIINGAAENNGQLALTVEFDVAGCPQDKSMSVVDFTQMSSNECQQNFYLSISELCAQDPTWPTYNPDFTLEGGVFLNDCGLFGMIGQP